MKWSERAPAKVNLTLHVTGIAANGYHLLDSLVVFGPAADLLSAEAASELSLTVGGVFAAGLDAEADNLVLRAARALAGWARRVPSGALRLDKHLPVASGIGGGSADAAAALRLLARLWSLDIPPDTMEAIAAGLGADVPVCLVGHAARMSGIGDQLAPAPMLPPCGMLLVNPGLALSTKDVFAMRKGDFSAPAVLPAGWHDAATMARDLMELRNDLEHAALALCPEIGVVLDALRTRPGCLLARMSGSGATCFALFDDAAGAARAAKALPATWWCSAGTMAV